MNEEERAARDKLDGDLVEALCEAESGLSEWDVKFVDSVAEQWERKGWISEKQREQLNRIAHSAGV